MHRLKYLLSDKFIRNNIVFFCGSMVVAFLNYLYYPVLGRMLKVADFGEVQAFISLVLIFGAFSGIFRNVITNIVSNRSDERDKETILMLQKAGLYFSIFISLVLIVFGSRFALFFNFKESYLFLALAITICLGVSIATHQAVIQGLGDFKALSVSSIIYSGGKVVLALVLVYLGLNVLGAVGGLVLAQAAALIYVAVYTYRNFRLDRGWKLKIDRRINKELWYALLVFAATVSVTFMYSGDTIIVKKLFSPETAGFYGGIATVGRIVFFAATSISAVLLPSVKIKNADGSNQKVLVKAAILTALIGGAALLIFSLFPSMIVSILIGRRYVEYAYLLPRIGLFLFFVSMANLLFFYLLALRDKFVFWAATAAPLLTVGWCIANHGTVSAVVNGFLAGSAVALILLSVRTSFEFRGKRKYEPANISGDSIAQ